MILLSCKDDKPHRPVLHYAEDKRVCLFLRELSTLSQHLTCVVHVLSHWIYQALTNMYIYTGIFISDSDE